MLACCSIACMSKEHFQQQTENIRHSRSRKHGHCFYTRCFINDNWTADKPSGKPGWKCTVQVHPLHSLWMKKRRDAQCFGMCWSASEFPGSGEIYPCWAWAQCPLKARGDLDGAEVRGFVSRVIGNELLLFSMCLQHTGKGLSVALVDIRGSCGCGAFPTCRASHR